MGRGSEHGDRGLAAGKASPPALLAVALLLALLAQGLRSYVFYSHTNADRLVQVEVARHLAAGRGWVRAVPAPDDLAAVTYRPEAGWPPGYALLVWPLHALSGDWFTAVAGGDALGLVLLFAGLWRLLRQLPGWRGAELAALAAAWGLGWAPWAYLGSTGLWAGAALLHALAALGRPRWLEAGLWLSLAILMRYAAYPLALLLPLAAGLAPRPRPWGRAGLATALAVGPTLAFQLLMPVAGSLYENPRLETARTWFPEHLLRMDVFPVKALVYLHPPKLAAALGLPEGLVTLALWGLAAGVLVSAAWAWRRLPRGLAWTWAATAALTIGPLVVLSLRVPPEVWGPAARWTYVMESRYYLPVMLLLPVLLVQAAGRAPGRRGWLARACLLLLLGGSLLHAGGRWYGRLAQPVARPAESGAFTAWQRGLVAAATGPGAVVAVHDGSPAGAMQAQVATWAGATVMDRQALLAQGGQASRPVRLLLVLPAAEAAAVATALGYGPASLTALDLPAAGPPVFALGLGPGGPLPPAPAGR